MCEQVITEAQVDENVKEAAMVTLEQLAGNDSLGIGSYGDGRAR
jgi:hypothetical protein